MIPATRQITPTAKLMVILTCASYEEQDSVEQGIHYESTQVDSYMYNDSVLYHDQTSLYNQG